MRISTVTFQTDSLAQMQQLQTELARTQSQLASGKKLQSAADDPLGMSQVNLMNAELSASQQYVRNGQAATATLQLQSSALLDATNLLERARDLAIQANNASLPAAQRQNIATQLTQELQNLVGIGNRIDAGGNYLFAGNASGTVPFAQSGSAVAYVGASGVSPIQISPNQRISAGDTGAAVFMNIPAGNGTFTTAGAATNGGTGSIGVGTVVTPSAWVADTYSISFTSPTAFTVTNSANALIASGSSFKDGDSISFNGIQVPISGTPAAGDKFTVARAGNASAFSTLQGLITTLSSPTASAAQISSQIGGALQQIDAALTNLDNVAASVGARINSISAAQSSAQTVQTRLATSVSQLSDVDYAAAITQLNTAELSLQAAQQSYAAIAKLSLFNYLK